MSKQQELLELLTATRNSLTVAIQTLDMAIKPVRRETITKAVVTVYKHTKHKSKTKQRSKK